MDFYRIKQRRGKNGTTVVYPDYVVCRSKDLMIQGRSFYAIWDEEAGLWSTDEYDVQRLIDVDLSSYEKWLGGKSPEPVATQYLSDFSTTSWKQFRSYMQNLSDNMHPLDKKITFADTEVRKEDYVSRRLSYSLAEPGTIAPAYEELISTLYDPSERDKLEWAIGAIIAGDAGWIQKFVVLYGSAGAGKSTFLSIVKKLFEGYYATFDAKALVGNNNQFATEAFRSNPLVAIQDDGDLSRIEDNTRLNSIISHEEIVINEKNKPTYTLALMAFLFMGTNKAVKITDAKSGIIRRLIDVQPSGRRVSTRHYYAIMQQINFELGAIARHCYDKYLSMGPEYYSDYRPVEMMLQTDIFYNYVEAHLMTLSGEEGIGLDQAYEMYKQYCDDALVEFKLPRHRFREELKNYYHVFEERKQIDGDRHRSWYSGFRHEVFGSRVGVPLPAERPLSLVLSDQDSPFESVGAEYQAQYATDSGVPSFKWDNVSTTLRDLDTTRTHFVRVPLNHIVIDFDLKDDTGEKNLELNLEAASRWPATYCEPSQSGKGLHLHYIYEGDAEALSRIFAPGIEIKVFTGLSSLRRKRSINNGLPITTISGGLPEKEKKVLNADAVKSEKGLRRLIARNLLKEIHPGTKPSIDFIYKILEDAYQTGLVYDVSDMFNDVLAFANNSSNNAMYCLKVVQYMKFASEEKHEDVTVPTAPSDPRIAYFDAEVFPNLFVVCWKFEGSDSKVVEMINPSPADVIDLLKLKLVGWNNRKYDNHILHAASLGYDNEALYRLSQRIVSNDRGALFGQAYGHSYFDMYEVSTKKQSLKKFQIELGLIHHELGLPWDEPVPEDMWGKVAEYCSNDVTTLEQVVESRQGDVNARKILAELSGRSMNDTTQQHAAAIIFEGNKKPQSEFVYTDLSEDFPGYEWDITTRGVVSTYQGEEVGEGGLVRANPGMYTNVGLLDIASMHPTSLIELNAFGDKYTANFKTLLDARLAIKHGDFEAARSMFGGRLKPYLTNEGDAKSLSYALKIAINIVYGLTSATFENPFKDPRNRDNIVAKRGALFMIDLKNALEAEGIEWIHIKTDSVKIANVTTEAVAFVEDFGRKYGYTFENEATYDRFALVNDAVYIARDEEDHHWSATGAQFAEPYVFKTLFSKDEVEFDDLVQVKSVTTSLYLDFSVEQPMVLVDRNEPAKFIGRVGAFVPVVEGCGGGSLLRLDKEGKKYHAVVGSKGYLWKESDLVETLKWKEQINFDYYEDLVYKARKNLEQYGDVEWFLSA